MAGAPQNWVGTQDPATGNAYVGVMCFSTNGGADNSIREYPGIALSAPLVPGQTYHAAVKAALTTGGVGTNGSFRYAVNRLGLLFTMQPFVITDWDSVPNRAHVQAVNVITDSIDWVSIEGSFIADSAYAYVVVGNFFPDITTAWSEVVPNGIYGYAYYYFDDVCVSLDPADCMGTSYVQQTDRATPVVFPAPFAENLTVAGIVDGRWAIRLYDLSGRVVRSQTHHAVNGSLHCSFRDLANGTFLLEGIGPKDHRLVKTVQSLRTN